MSRFFLMKNRSVAALREDFEEEKTAQASNRFSF